MIEGGRRAAGLLIAAVLASSGAGCNKVDIKAADQASRRRVEAKLSAAVQAPEGFRAVLVVEGLNYPSSIAWDGGGQLYVLESGTVPIPTLHPKILKAGASGLEEVRIDGGIPGTQAVGIAFHDGWLYLSHEEKEGTWGVSRVRPEGGRLEPVVSQIPSRGDHWVNYPVFDAKGTLWFGVGSATNSGVVSSHDPVDKKWIKKRPDAHDIACHDLVLRGSKFTEDDALAPGTRSTTGAYQPYRSSGETKIAGQVPCTGALFRLPAGASKPELVAWGFRNPVALAVDASGTVYVGMQGADIRGTRPVRDDPDAVYRAKAGAWYGWPDFSADLRPLTDPAFRPPDRFLSANPNALEPVIDREKSGLAAPDRGLLVGTTEPHAALGGMTLVPASGPFARWAGQLLLSEMGDFKPATDPAEPDKRAGFQVEALDPSTGRRTVFARNRGTGPADAASHIDRPDGFERPVDVKIGPDGLVYVVDFGAFESTEKSGKVFPKTGRVFRIEPVP